MRKLIVSNIMSLDGYYEGPGENVMVLPMDEAFDAYNAERLRAADTLLLGRNTYDGFKGFRPSVADDPNFTPTHWEISRLDNAIDKVVISDSMTREQTRTPRLPNSNAKPAKTSWSLAAAHSGTTCWPMGWLTNYT
jgi:dihydrofolate reductase